MRQGCLLSPFLFLLAIDLIMKKTTQIEEMGPSGHIGASWKIWTLRMTSPSSHTAINRCRKNRAAKYSVNTCRTQLQQKQDKDYESQHKEQQPHNIERKATGRDRLVHILVGTEEDVKARIQKARVAFIMLRKIWRAKQIKINTKLRIFNSNVIGDMARVHRRH